MPGIPVLPTLERFGATRTEREEHGQDEAMRSRCGRTQDAPRQRKRRAALRELGCLAPGAPMCTAEPAPGLPRRIDGVDFVARRADLARARARLSIRREAVAVHRSVGAVESVPRSEAMPTPQKTGGTADLSGFESYGTCPFATAASRLGRFWRVSCLAARRMPIASLVVTLDERTGLRQSALARLVEDCRVEIGEPRGPHLPIVLDTLTVEESVHAVEAFLSTPGVLGVDVVRIDFAVDEDPQ